MRIIFIILFCLNISCIFGQGEANNWIVSVAGISFNNDTVTTDLSWPPNVGYAAISDCRGNLLFYTDGANVYDRDRNVMPNGSQISGNGGGAYANAPIIVGSPGNDDQYFVFVNTPPELRYSIVDMGLNNGLGDVTNTKRILLFDQSTDLLRGTLHANKRDVWIVAMDSLDFRLHSFLINPAGASISPIITNISFPSYSPASMLGFKASFSPQGDKFAFTELKWTYTSSPFHLLHFNNSTGIFDNHITFNNTGLGALEFSPDGNKLYLSDSTIGDVQFSHLPTLTQGLELSVIKQYDVSNWNLGDILASEVEVARPPAISNWTRDHIAMQIAPNGKIYVLSNGDDYLGSINHPNVSGPACGYNDSTIFILGTFYDPFQNFISSFFDPEPYHIVATGTVCAHEAVAFALNDTVRLDSVLWHFGDGRTAVGRFPVHSYSQPGTYSVGAVAWYRCSTDTLWGTVTVTPGFTLDLGRDTAFCHPFAITLDATQPIPAAYLWSDGGTGPMLTAATPGIYWVEVSGTCPSVSDTVTFSLGTPPAVSLGPDTALCFTRGESLLLDAGSGPAYLWADGGTGRYAQATAPGTYWVRVLQGLCANSDTVILGESCPFVLYIPNAFTPNNDGNNDVFRVSGHGLEGFSMQIFDRWGEKIFGSTDINVGWDGTFKGQPAEPGAYIYHIAFALPHSTPQERKGSVLLVR